MRLGALIAGIAPEKLCGFIPFGFRVGAAFQIQDDILNLIGEEQLYGKETNGDIAEGKRTLMIIHAMSSARPSARAALDAIYAKPRADKSASDIAFVLNAIHDAGSIDYARDIAHRLTMSAKRLFDERFRWIPPGSHRRFIEEMIHYMIVREL
jgi:geranylgeranyl diphosphate synthase type II